jgi:hypothetical protein
MVQTAESRHGYNPALCIWNPHFFTTCRRSLPQREMRPVLVVVADVLVHQPLQMPYVQNLIGVIPKSSFPCGIGIVWNSTRMCQASEWAAASQTSTGTNSNFRQPPVNLDATAHPGGLSKSIMEVRHDSQ